MAGSKGRMAGIAMLETTVFKDNIETKETRYYVSSLNSAPADILKSIRKHWGIESMHYILDVVFIEDDCRVRQNNAA